MTGPGEVATAPSWGKASAWLRPFDELEVGDSYVSKGRTITEADIVRFAGMTAEGGPVYGGLGRDMQPAGEAAVAPELLALAYSIGLIPNDFVRALRRIVNLRFLQPVRCGDTIHAEAEIVHLADWTPQLGLVTGAWRIVEQGGAAAITVELEAVWLRARP